MGKEEKEGYLKDLGHDARQHLSAFMTQIGMGQAEKIVRHEETTVANEILKSAEALKADLIVVSTQGKGAVARSVMGSVAQQVLKEATIDVMAVATYPFFGKVAELVGRLSAIQGDCAAAEVHRRMSETYGEREGTRRMTNMVIQSQASWCAVERVEKGKRVIRLAPTTIDNDELTAWLIEAAVRYAGKPVSVPSLQSVPALFPFTLTRPLAYVVSNSENLSLRSEGPSNQFVALQNR